MKKIFVTLISVAMFVTPAMAADVELTVTVPDAYVSRLAAAVQGRFDCGPMTTKQCAEYQIREWLKGVLRTYEGDQIMAPAIQARDAIEDIEVN